MTLVFWKGQGHRHKRPLPKDPCYSNHRRDRRRRRCYWLVNAVVSRQKNRMEQIKRLQARPTVCLVENSHSTHTPFQGKYPLIPLCHNRDVLSIIHSPQRLERHPKTSYQTTDHIANPPRSTDDTLKGSPSIFCVSTEPLFSSPTKVVVPGAPDPMRIYTNKPE